MSSELQVADGVFSTENKNFIRKKWNEPIIKFLSRKIGEKLIYIGLPSSDADDIKQWLDYIKSVIAFQCREYGKSSEPNQSRESIEKLEEFLRQLERQSKIEDFVVYDGYVEEIVLKGYDNSPNEIEFSPNKFITLYNLDFCDDIASPLEYVDRNGDTKTAYKINAIQRLLEIQSSLSEVSNKFIFFLTVHCSYNGGELQNFLNNPPDSIIRNKLQEYFKLKGEERNARIVRLFVIHYIQTYFKAFNFSFKVLPVIKYNGINGTPLLHFAVLGTHSIPTANGVHNYQTLESVVNQKFLTVDSSGFANTGLDEESSITTLCPITFFTQTQTYQKLWIK